MELRHLRYFVAVAEELNFTRAAERLHTAQPSLCQQIKQLEESLGTALLERDTHRVELTAAGHVLLREARKILHRTQRAVELVSRAASGESGPISIGVCTWAEIRIVPRLLPLMAQRLPGVKISVHSLTAVEQVERLVDRSLDIGFLRGPFNEPTLTAEEVLREEIVVVLPSDHRLAKAKRVSMQVLNDLPCILTSERHPARDIATALCAQGGIRVRRAQTADSAISHLNMVAAGLGFALLPAYVKLILPRGVITKPLDLDPVPTVSLVAACRSENKLPALKQLRMAVRKHIAEVAPDSVHPTLV